MYFDPAVAQLIEHHYRAVLMFDGRREDGGAEGTAGHGFVEPGAKVRARTKDLGRRANIVGASSLRERFERVNNADRHRFGAR